jgi:protein OS-9
MTTTDHILFVKEAKTCSYVLVVQTPRLCGEPGFKSRSEQRDEALIRCREVVDSLAHADPALPEADVFFKRPARTKPVLPPPPPGKDKGGDALRKALEALLGSGGGDLAAGVLVEKLSEDGELVVEFIGEDELGAELGEDVAGTLDIRDEETIAAILRAAGIEVEGAKDDAQKKAKARTKTGQDAPEPEPAPVPRDEL